MTIEEIKQWAKRQQESALKINGPPDSYEYQRALGQIELLDDLLELLED